MDADKEHRRNVPLPDGLSGETAVLAVDDAISAATADWGDSAWRQVEAKTETTTARGRSFREAADRLEPHEGRLSEADWNVRIGFEISVGALVRLADDGGWRYSHCFVDGRDEQRVAGLADALTRRIAAAVPDPEPESEPAPVTAPAPAPAPAQPASGPTSEPRAREGAQPAGWRTHLPGFLRDVSVQVLGGLIVALLLIVVAAVWGVSA